MSLTNAQYDAIMRDYEKNRSLNKQENDRRQQEVYEKIPAYKALDLSLPDISLALVKSLSEHGASSLHEFRQKIAAVTEEKKKLLAAHSYPADYLDPVFTCKDCRDTGIVDGRRCHCYYVKVRQYCYKNSHLSELIRTNNFDVMKEYHVRDEDRAHFRHAVETCKDFISSFGTENAASGLVFHGPVGTGKTFLTLSVAKEIMDRGFSVLYFTAISLFQNAGDATFHSDDANGRNAFFNDLYDCDLLIIDDLGTELVNTYTLTQLYNCINERFLRHTSTLISTNLDLHELYDLYTDRIFSRLVNQYIQCELTGDDVRVMKIREANAGMPHTRNVV